MNFLAHFHLAWPEEEHVAGGLEGDFYKGLLDPALPAGLARGIRLHRAIDAFTDEHQSLQALRREFPPQLRRYAGILMDLSFDHYLSLHWQQFSPMALDQFSNEVYDILDRHEPRLSERAQLMARRLRQHQLLTRYQHWETIPASAERIGERFRRGNPLRETGAALAPLQALLETTFLDFYPDLVRFSTHYQESSKEPPP